MTGSLQKQDLDWAGAYTLDTRGQACPQPLLAMRRALGELPTGTLLRVLATDPGSWRDFHSYAELSRRPLLRAEQRGGVFSYWIKRDT